MFFVLNERRMLTETVEGALEIFDNIKYVSRLNFTGIVNNTHLMEYTDTDVLLKGVSLAQKFSDKVKLPIVYNCVSRKLIDEIDDEEIKKIKNIFTVDLFVGPQFK